MTGKIVKIPYLGSKSSDLFFERRRQIFEAAVQLFAEKGYHSATVREIAERAGLGKGTLYEYIRSKKEMLYLVIEEGHIMMFDQLDILVESDMEPLEKWKQAMSIQLTVMEGHSETFRALLPEIKGLEQTDHLWMEEMKKKYISRFQKIFDECVEAGLFRPVDSYVVCEIACNSFMQWEESASIREKMGNSVQKYHEFIMDILINGLSVEK